MTKINLANRTGITIDEFKTWLNNLIIDKKGALPDLADWKDIKEMLDKVGKSTQESFDYITPYVNFDIKLQNYGISDLSESHIDPGMWSDICRSYGINISASTNTQPASIDWETLQNNCKAWTNPEHIPIEMTFNGLPVNCYSGIKYDTKDIEDYLNTFCKGY